STCQSRSRWIRGARCCRSGPRWKRGSTCASRARSFRCRGSRKDEDILATVAQPLGGARSGPSFAERLAHIPYHWQALVVIVPGLFMVVLDTTIVNVALPRIIQVFQSDVNEGQLILTGYMLALAVVMPATGYLADTFGSRRIYLLTIILFTVG